MASTTRDQEKKKVLFLCTHNSARYQMAEGLLRSMYPDRYEACSGGVMATSIDPSALRAMMEIGIPLSDPKPLEAKARAYFLTQVYPSRLKGGMINE